MAAKVLSRKEVLKIEKRGGASVHKEVGKLNIDELSESELAWWKGLVDTYEPIRKMYALGPMVREDGQVFRKITEITPGDWEKLIERTKDGV